MTCRHRADGAPLGGARCGAPATHEPPFVGPRCEAHARHIAEGVRERTSITGMILTDPSRATPDLDTLLAAWRMP